MFNSEKLCFLNIDFLNFFNKLLIKFKGINIYVCSKIRSVWNIYSDN